MEGLRYAGVGSRDQSEVECGNDLKVLDSTEPTRLGEEVEDQWMSQGVEDMEIYKYVGME